MAGGLYWHCYLKHCNTLLEKITDLEMKILEEISTLLNKAFN